MANENDRRRANALTAAELAKLDYATRSSGIGHAGESDGLELRESWHALQQIARAEKNDFDADVAVDGIVRRLERRRRLRRYAGNFGWLSGVAACVALAVFVTPRASNKKADRVNAKLTFTTDLVQAPVYREGEVGELSWDDGFDEQLNWLAFIAAWFEFDFHRSPDGFAHASAAANNLEQRWAVDPL